MSKLTPEEQAELDRLHASYPGAGVPAPEPDDGLTAVEREEAAIRERLKAEAKPLPDNLLQFPKKPEPDKPA
jgi:hypothetical protein